MTTRTIYVPRLIESAEQAEALPRGTQRLQDGREGLAVGWTALVPIEAEEERLDPTDLARLRGAIPSTRFVTPWEEA